MTARKGSRLRKAFAGLLLQAAALLLLTAAGFASAQTSQASAQASQPAAPAGQPSQSGAPLTQSSSPPTLPSAPQPAVAQAKPIPNPVGPCELRNAAATMAATAAVRATAVAENDTQALSVPPRLVGITTCVPHLPMINWYARFLNGPAVKPLTPLQKAHLAGRNLIDPFNLLTIGGEAAIAVASNSHSIYGPGWDGFAKNVGTSFTQDMVGEFFGTFLIPSVTHLDPHYHRMPNATIKRRAFHCIWQIAWTQGDNGEGKLNYSTLVGFAIEGQINNLYVPGQQTNAGATAARYGTALGLAPIDNFITEFLPDIASHIHVRVVLVQSIINQVARTESGASTD
jgi:hypothetical protein